jgi:hypothetical protein
MKTIPSLIAGLLLSPLACAAHADATYEGHIAYHKDVAYHRFILISPGTLRIWTDSYNSGANFDPIIAVWRDGTLLAQNDDNPVFTANQTSYDAGIALLNLGAGSYVVTVAAYGNVARATTMGGGFRYDGQAPIRLDTWCQPFSHCKMAPHFSLHWTVTP